MGVPVAQSITKMNKLTCANPSSLGTECSIGLGHYESASAWTTCISKLTLCFRILQDVPLVCDDSLPLDFEQRSGGSLCLFTLRGCLGKTFSRGVGRDRLVGCQDNLQLLSGDPTFRGMAHVVILQCCRSDTLRVAVIRVRRHLSENDVIFDLFLPIAQDRQRADWASVSGVLDDLPIRVVLLYPSPAFSFRVARVSANTVRVLPDNQHLLPM